MPTHDACSPVRRSCGGGGGGSRQVSGGGELANKNPILSSPGALRDKRGAKVAGGARCRRLLRRLRTSARRQKARRGPSHQSLLRRRSLRSSR